MATSRAIAKTLINYYRDLYLKTFDTDKVMLQMNKSVFGFESMVIDFGKPKSEALIDYYIGSYSEPDALWFANNYDKINDNMEIAESDRKARLEQRKNTAKRMKGN